MPRITCDTPSPDKPIVVRTAVGTSNVVLLEAPDFDVPSLPGDTNPRRVIPGMVEIITPILFSNTTASTIFVNVSITDQADDTTALGANIPVPANDTLLFPVQGQFLVKTNESATNGDRLIVSASTATGITATISAIEKEASDHIPEQQL